MIDVHKTTQIQLNSVTQETRKTTHVRGSPNPWATSTKHHIMYFHSNQKSYNLQHPCCILFG